jgi:hypothetical protein
LLVDGTTTFLKSAEGGNAFADVFLEPVTEELIQRKRPEAVRFEDLLVQVPMWAIAPLASWINATLMKGPSLKNGALVYLDFNNNEVKRLEFTNAVIADVSLPACDAASQDPAYLTLRLTPDSTRLVGGNDKPTNATAGAATFRRSSNGAYRLNIQGLEPACARVSKIAALSAKRALLPTSSGDPRGTIPRQFAALDCSALRITLPEQDAGPFYAWFADFAVNGNNKSDMERAGRIEWLNPVDAKTIAIADLSNLGIVRFAPLSLNSGDQAPRVQVDMYCESMKLAVAG